MAAATASQLESKADPLGCLRAFDQAYKAKDKGALGKMLTDDALLHGDGTVLEVEVKGRDAVSKAFGDYFETYNFQHEVIIEAANPKDQLAFSFWEDRYVADTGQEHEGGSVLGVWELVLDAEGAVKEIWCMRQLTDAEEQHLDFKPVMAVSLDRDAASVPAITISEEQRTELDRMSRKYNEMWMHRKVELAEELLSPGFVSQDFITGRVMDGRDAVVEVIRQMPAAWVYESGSLDVALVPHTNKMFGRWFCTGHMEGEQGSANLWGLGFLAFTPSTLQLEIDFSSMSAWKKMEDATPPASKAA